MSHHISRLRINILCLASSQALKLGVVSPLFYLSLRVNLDSRRPPDEYSKPMCHTSSDCLCDLYVSSFVHLLIVLDRTAHPYRVEPSSYLISSSTNRPSTYRPRTFSSPRTQPRTSHLISYLSLLTELSSAGFHLHYTTKPRTRTRTHGGFLPILSGKTHQNEP